MVIGQMTKQQKVEAFTAYEMVRARGNYNMWDSRAQEESGLDEETYLDVLSHYSEYAEVAKND